MRFLSQLDRNKYIYLYIEFLLSDDEPETFIEVRIRGRPRLGSRGSLPEGLSRPVVHAMARTAEAHQDQDDGGQMEQQGPRRPSPSPSSGSSPVPPADDGGDDAIRVLPDVEHGGGVGGATSPSGTDTSSAGDVDTMVYVVTGANCGIGFEVAKRLARREREQRKLPAPRKDIVLACKDLTAAHEAVKRLAKFCPDDNTILVRSKLFRSLPLFRIVVFLTLCSFPETQHPMQVELGNAASTASFGLDMKRKFAKVDCVVCNAGVLVPVPKVVVVPQANKRAAAGTSGTSGIAATTAAAEDDHGDEVAEDRRLIQAPEDHRRPQGVGGGPIGGGEAGAAAPDTVDDVFENEGLEPERNTDGLETNVGTNHVGHVFLISVLMPLLMNAPAGRYINIYFIHFI